MRWIRGASTASRRAAAATIIEDLLEHVTALECDIYKLKDRSGATEIGDLLRHIGAEILANATHNRSSETPGWIAEPHRGRINKALAEIIRKS